MSRWQYAWLRDEPQMAVFFSHPQGPALIPELMAVIGQSLFTHQSTEYVLSLDKSTLNVPYFCGLLGDRGWELAGVTSNPVPGALGPVMQTTMYFKRPVA